MFVIYTSSLLYSMAAMIFVRSWPALPTKGRPWISSSRPGASPTNISSEWMSPSPGTAFFRSRARRHFWQFRTCFSREDMESSPLTEDDSMKSTPSWEKNLTLDSRFSISLSALFSNDILNFIHDDLTDLDFSHFFSLHRFSVWEDYTHLVKV